jgi:hypothetical protein
MEDQFGDELLVVFRQIQTSSFVEKRLYENVEVFLGKVFKCRVVTVERLFADARLAA